FTPDLARLTSNGSSCHLCSLPPADARFCNGDVEQVQLRSRPGSFSPTRPGPIAALAHNLLRWTTLIGLPDTIIPTARTIRRRLLSVPGRITRTGRTGARYTSRALGTVDRG
ncbi:MAG: hypothetical protein ACXVHX_39480, partial [Solirubrobacteraceae bacterium]